MPFVRKCGNDILERGRPQMTVRRMRISYWIPNVTDTHTLRLCNTHCLPTATMVARMRLIVTLYVHCMSCYVFRISF